MKQASGHRYRRAVVIGLAVVAVATSCQFDQWNEHLLAVDATGKIIPWTTDAPDGYGHVVTLASYYLLARVPIDPSNGKPAYYSHSYLNPDTQELSGTP